MHRCSIYFKLRTCRSGLNINGFNPLQIYIGADPIRLKGAIARPLVYAVHVHNILNTSCLYSKYCIYFKFKPKVKMQFKNAITIINAMAGMHKLCVFFGSQVLK